MVEAKVPMVRARTKPQNSDQAGIVRSDRVMRTINESKNVISMALNEHSEDMYLQAHFGQMSRP